MSDAGQVKLEVPKTLDFDEKTIEAMSRKLRIARGGLIAAVLGGVENSVSQGSWFPMFVLNWWPLKDEKDASTVQKNLSVKSYIVAPFETPDVRKRYSPMELEIKQSQFSDMLTNNFRAVFGADVIPEFPRYDRQDKVYVFQGSPLPSKDAADEARKEINRGAMLLAKKLWQDPNGWTTPNYHGAYLSMEINENGYPQVKRVHGEIPEGGSLMPFEQWFVEEG